MGKVGIIIKAASGVVAATATLLTLLKDNPQLSDTLNSTVEKVKAATNSSNPKLRFDGRITAIEACADAVAENFPDLTEPERWRRKASALRMRGELAAALLHSPELVILDEPTIGLDVLSKAQLREFLRAERAARGTTLLLTTHDMSDIEHLCERVLLVDSGRLVYDGDLASLARTVGAKRVLVVDLATPHADLPTLTDASGTPLPVDHVGSEGDGLRHRFAFDAGQTSAAAVLAAVSTHAEVRDLAIEEPDIEDVVRHVYSAGLSEG